MFWTVGEDEGGSWQTDRHTNPRAKRTHRCPPEDPLPHGEKSKKDGDSGVKRLDRCVRNELINEECFSQNESLIN